MTSPPAPMVGPPLDEPRMELYLSFKHVRYKRTGTYDSDVTVKHVIFAAVDARVDQYEGVVFVRHVSVSGADTVKELEHEQNNK